MVDTPSPAVQSLLTGKDFTERRARSSDPTSPFEPPADFARFLASEGQRYRTLATDLHAPPTTVDTAHHAFGAQQSPTTACHRLLRPSQQVSRRPNLALDDLEGCAPLAREPRTSLPLGENVYGPRELYRAVTMPAGDCVMPDRMRVTETAHGLEWRGWAEPILQEPLPLVARRLRFPDRARIGIEWGEDAVRRLAS